MTVLPVDLSLASAALSGGAQLAATGGGLPQRITTETDGFVDLVAILAGGSSNINAAILAADNSGDVILCLANSTSRRYSKTGALVWGAISTPNARSLWRQPGGPALMGREVASAPGWFEIDETTGVATPKTFAVAATHKQFVTIPGGTADRAWYHQGATTLFEVVYSTGALTGRTITTTATLAIYGSNWDGVPSIYVLETTARITRYRESDLTLIGTWTTAPGSGNSGVPASAFGNSGLIVQADGKIIVKSDSPFAFDRITATPTLNLHTLANVSLVERVLWGATEFAGPQQNFPSGGAQLLPAFDISPNGRYLMFVGSTPAPTAIRAATIRNIQTQTVEWTVALTGQTAWMDTVLPGNLGGKYDLFPANWNAGALADQRNGRVFYQRVGLDGARVFLPHGMYVPTGGLSLVGATALKFGVEMDMGLARSPGARPYVGGPAGEGPRVYLESGLTPHRNRLQRSV